MLGRGQDAASAPLSHGAVHLWASSSLCPNHTSWPRSQAVRAPPSLWLALWPLLAPHSPPDSAGTLPGRPVAGNFHWAVAQHHVAPQDPSPVCTEKLTGFVPGQAAAGLPCPVCLLTSSRGGPGWRELLLLLRMGRPEEKSGGGLLLGSSMS